MDLTSLWISPLLCLHGTNNTDPGEQNQLVADSFDVSIHLCLSKKEKSLVGR